MTEVINPRRQLPIRYGAPRDQAAWEARVGECRKRMQTGYAVAPSCTLISTTRGELVGTVDPVEVTLADFEDRVVDGDVVETAAERLAAAVEAGVVLCKP